MPPLFLHFQCQAMGGGLSRIRDRVYGSYVVFLLAKGGAGPLISAAANTNHS